MSEPLIPLLASASLPRLKKREHLGGKRIYLVKETEPDEEAKALHVQSAQTPPRSGLPVSGRPF